MSLGEYRSKRDFGVTSEPAGTESAGTGPASTGAPAIAPHDGVPAEASDRRFVVQRHRARRTHYDFRLEVDGVLASWAMPKGPTLDPSVKALAVHVEDHPIEYRDFEGVIPKGQYGGGDVIVWDRGTWTPARDEDPARSIAAGELHMDLFGEKLAGRFVLVRTRTERGQEQWLMLHKHDDFAAAGWSPDDHPRSVKSGRTNDEVAAAPASLWHSARPVGEAEEVLAPSWDPASADELAALDGLGAGGNWELQGREVKLTNLDKVLFPARSDDPPVTKRDLVRYFVRMAPVMLPYLADRPVNLHRFPDGVDRPGFWHKQAPAYAPDWLTRWRYEEAGPGDSEYYFVVDSVAALAWMANYAAVELHPWTSSTNDARRPTWALIDIDPGAETSPEDVLVLARLFRAGLEHLELVGAPKLTGQRGIHIWVPIEPRYTFHETSAWVEQLSRAVGATVPSLVSWTWQKSARSGLARLDYTQNAINKTLVAPYSTRAAPGAPVSAPIQWDELDDPQLLANHWTVRSLPERVDKMGDLFAPALHLHQTLPDI